MAAGRPIVATDVGASATLLDGGRCGILAASSRDDDLIGAFRKLLADPGTARRMGEAARDRVADEYSRDAMRLRFEDFYRRLAGVPIR